MRRGGETLGVDQGFTLWSTYSYGIYAGHKKERQALLAALPPDDHISTLNWALDQHPSEYELYRDGIRYYVALLNISAGHVERARDDLRALEKKLATSSGSLPDAVQAALKSVSPELTSQTAGGR
jgi:hypothetical protein